MGSWCSAVLAMVLSSLPFAARAEPEQPGEPAGYTRSVAVADGIAGATGLLTVGGLGLACLVDIYGESPNQGISDDAWCTAMFGGAILTAGVYALGGPTVHVIEGRFGRAVASFGLRVGLPLGLGALGYASGNPDILTWSVIGGVGGALVIDWFVLARPSPPEVSPGVVLVPFASGGGLGFAGSF